MPPRPEKGVDGLMPEASMHPAEQTTVLMLLEDARRRPVVIEEVADDPERQMVEMLLVGIESVRSGESDAVSLDGPAGYIPLEINPENVEAVAVDLDMWVPPHLRDVLYDQSPIDYDVTPINTEVRESETGSAA